MLLLLGVGRTPGPGALDPVRLLPEPGAQLALELQGRLLEDPRPETGGGCRGILQLEGGRSQGRTELRLASCPLLHQGWRVRVQGQLSSLRPAPHPLLAGPAERLGRQGVWSRLRVEQLQVLERPATPIADLRRRIAERLIAAAGPERGGLLAALVLGSAVVPLPQELRDSFRVAGLSHALAASGFHLSVLLGAVLPLGRSLGRPLRLTLAGGAILLFLLLAGPQPSVVRAVLTGGMGLLILEAGRRARPLALLLLTAVVMLLLRPDWLADVGFQLSVAATAALLVTARPLEQALHPWLPRWLRPNWTAPALAVPLAATLWTLPLQLLHFGVVPLYAVPANLLAAPLLTPLTLGAMGLSLVALLAPPLLGVLLLPVDLLARLLLLVAQLFAALPMAQWQTGRPLPLLVLLLSLALLGWLVPGLGRPWRRWGTALFACVVAVHLGLLSGDQLLLVHQPDRDLLLARHHGRGALVSSRSDGFACHQARQLATGLGLQRFDWVVLLDPVAAADPACWQGLTATVLADSEQGPPLLSGQRLASPGLAVAALSPDSQALRLEVGSRRWWLLPDRQAFWAWERQGPAAAGAAGSSGLWLGFAPRPAERQRLQARGAPRLVWWSGAPPAHGPLPPGWRASGASGSLLASGA